MEQTKVRDYEMFSPAGNRACDSLVKKIEKKVTGTKRITKDELIVMIKEGMKKISEKHGEVYDTEPEYHICDYVNRACKSVGYDFELIRFEI